MQLPLLNRAWYELLRWTLFGLATFVCRVRFTGRENVPKEGGVLMVANHQSHFDPPLIGMGCPRRVNYVARSTLFSFALFGWLIKSVGAIPIDRDGMGMSGIKESLKRLKRGEVILIFPEGTRSSDGEIAEFRPGFTTLAVRSGAAIVPAAIDGAFAAWPRCRKLPRLGKIRVHYGKPILPAEIAGLDERELSAEVERRVRECHAQLKKRATASPATTQGG